MGKCFYLLCSLALLQGCATSQPAGELAQEQPAPVASMTPRPPRLTYVVLPSGDTILTTATEAAPPAAKPKTFLGRVLAGKMKQKNVGNTTINVTVTDRSKVKSKDTEKTKLVDNTKDKAKEKTVSKPVTKTKTRTDSHDKEKLKVKHKPTTNSGFLASPGSQVAAIAIGLTLVLLFLFFKSKKSA